MSGALDARDTLTVVLLKARKLGIRIDEGRFVPTVLTVGCSLGSAIRDVREDLQAVEGQLARCEEMARREVKRA
jgi:hypothetical protein